MAETDDILDFALWCAALVALALADGLLLGELTVVMLGLAVGCGG